jgi:predicted DNA-binding transcriptional regulator AlpA
MGSPIAISIAECAALMQVTRKHVYTLINTDPTFPRPFKVGNCTRILLAELEQWLANKAQKAREEHAARQSKRSQRTEAARAVPNSGRSEVSGAPAPPIHRVQCTGTNAPPPPKFVLIGE